jgi:phosphate starvation-inducible protein PhoH
MGHLPGDVTEKMEIYKQPYVQICDTLFDRKDAYQRLEEQGYIDFISTSFIRGSTLSDCILVVDEIQNMDFGELDSVITRVGNNCKTYFCGDFRQSDFRRDVERSGVHKFMSIIKGMNLFEFVEFNSSDIVRCELVKQYIIEKERLEIVT